MEPSTGGARTVAVRGGSESERDAVVALLVGADLALAEADDAEVVVLVDPSPDDWRAIAPGAKTVLVTSRALTADEVLRVVLQGADAVVEADAARHALPIAIQVVAAGGTELSPALVRRVADALRVNAQDDASALYLTPRERDILMSIDSGETVKQTARTLGISPKTVENLQSRLFRKLGVRNRAQAVALAHSLGLLAPGADQAAARKGRGDTR